ncbi:MAG: nucleotidyl transferase AbiEii/AbiGii toxin family protein [Desulfobacterota bacterium]|nr:nucleotidyl transferase AbiEii/AbiGii toxin family protein [Thermodesulfobacteriota bacterium]
MEALDRLNSARLVGRLVFTGSTMLRLCYGLNRFSVELDFWTAQETDIAPCCCVGKSLYGLRRKRRSY